MAECPVSSSCAQAATTTSYTLPGTMGVLTSYYTYGFPTFVAIVIGLYLLFTGERVPGIYQQVRRKLTTCSRFR